jgi:hypothetical protein
VTNSVSTGEAGEDGEDDKTMMNDRSRLVDEQKLLLRGSGFLQWAKSQVRVDGVQEETILFI